MEQHFGITPRAYRAMARDGLFAAKRIGKAIFANYDDVKRAVTEGAELRKRVDRAVAGDAAGQEQHLMGPQEVIRYIEAARTPKEEKDRRAEMRHMIGELHTRYDDTLEDGSPNPEANVKMQELALDLRLASWSAQSVPRPPRTRRSRRS